MLTCAFEIFTVHRNRKTLKEVGERNVYSSTQKRAATQRYTDTPAAQAISFKDGGFLAALCNRIVISQCH